MSQDKILDKILTKVDSLATKEDLGKIENQVDIIVVKVVDIEEQLKNKPNMEYVDEKFDIVLNSVDRFVKLHETLDQELSALRSKYTRLEERLEIVERKLQVA